MATLRVTTALTTILCAIAVSVADLQAYCSAPLPEFHTMDGAYAAASLVHVAVVARHGDRTPCSVLPVEDVVWDVCADTEVVTPRVAGGSDFVQAVTIPTAGFGRLLWRGNCAVGQLTSKGQQQHVALGARMREIYVNKLGLLSPVLNTTELYVRSSDVWRTKQSAMAHISGLYPLAAQNTVKLYTQPLEIEAITPNSEACPRISTLVVAALQSDAWKAHDAEMAPLMKRLQSLTGAQWPLAIMFADVVNSRFCHGLKLPCKGSDCLSLAEAQQLSKFADWERGALHGGDEIVKLDVGYFVTDELVPNMLSANATGVPKYAVYSAHDDTLTALLGAFRLDMSTWPPFASHLVLELWRLGPQLLVRVIYNGALQVVPGCTGAKGTVCTWEEFRTIVANRLTISDYATACAA